MTEILETVERWRAAGRKVAIGTVVAVEFSAPRDPGAAMAVNDAGEVAGSVSGGCVEGAVYEEAQDVLRSGRPRLVTYGISDADAISVGLTCGGTLHVFVEMLDDEVFAALARAVRADRPIAVATHLDGATAGAKRVVDGDGKSFGSLGSAGLDHAVAGEAAALLATGETAVRTFGQDGEPVGVEVRVFINAFAPKPNMYVFGAIDFSRAMVHVGKDLGYRVSVIDARPIFATKQRFPQADEVVVSWPDEFLTNAPVEERTALIILTHDVKFDIPLIQVALRTPAGYIGAMGSRKTHANRIARLREAGIGEQQLARISAPIGLDIGARTPEETAISIAAEIIALRTGRQGGRLTGGAESGSRRRARFVCGQHVIVEDAFDVDAPVDAVWSLLKDIPRVASCIPGVEVTEVIDPRTYRAKASVKVGPVSVSYNATIAVESLDEAAHRAELAVKGDESRGRGGVSAKLISEVLPREGGSHVTLKSDAKISGIVATVGGRLIEGVAKKTIATFAENLRKLIA